MHLARGLYSGILAKKLASPVRTCIWDVAHLTAQLPARRARGLFNRCRSHAVDAL